MSKIIKIFNDKEMQIPDFTGKDFARLIVKGAKQTQYKFPKGNVIIRFTTIDWYTSKFALLIYSKKNENDYIKEALLVPLPIDSINNCGISINNIRAAINILNDDILHRRLNIACNYLNKKYNKRTTFFYDNTYTPYTESILSGKFDDAELKEIVKNNLSLGDLINVWKNTNMKAANLYESCIKVGENFTEKINPDVYPRNLSESLFTDKCEIRDMLNTLTIFKNSLRRRRHEIGTEEYRIICSKLSEISSIIDKTYKKPMICFVREN